jgi:hypothetical protein
VRRAKESEDQVALKPYRPSLGLWWWMGVVVGVSCFLLVAYWSGF